MFVYRMIQTNSCFKLSVKSVKKTIGKLFSFFLNNLIIYSLVADNKIYIKSVTSSTVNYSSFCVDDYAPFLFNNIFINENVRCDCFNVSYHVGTPIINAILSNGVKYTAALDDQFTFKTYKWNYIDCKALSNMISANVGSGLIVRGTELNLFSFDIQGLSAVGNIYFQDVIFHSCIFNASQIHSKNFASFSLFYSQ